MLKIGYLGIVVQVHVFQNVCRWLFKAILAILIAYLCKIHVYTCMALLLSIRGKRWMGLFRKLFSIMSVINETRHHIVSKLL